MAPDQFIPIAESSGQIVEIGDWVFHQAVQQVQRWRRDFHPEFQISVNKSPVQFHNDAGRQHAWFVGEDGEYSGYFLQLNMGKPA